MARRSLEPVPGTAPTQAAVLGKAVVRAAAQLGVTQDTLAGVLGLSTATVSRLVAGDYPLKQGRKEWELALLFVRLFRSLDSIVGTAEAARTWLRGDNLALGAAPAALITDLQGLVRVVDYLDHHRGRI
jgi:DNA-binding XRE family transcriptional regulator